MSRRRAVTISTLADISQYRLDKSSREAFRLDPGEQDIDAFPSHGPTPAPNLVPPSGGHLGVAFHSSETGLPVPPTFFPGDPIPTVLTFNLPHGTSLPLALNPTLTLSLVGTLRTDTTTRTIIDISVSLAEGLALWARDAGVIDEDGALPSGGYTLPLSAQIPTSPRLPPTFAVPSAAFGMSYALCASLSCDAPEGHGQERILIARAAAPFDLYPATLPTPSPRILPHSFWVPSSSDTTERWVVQASLPTGTYSPTSVIPLELAIHPPVEKRPRSDAHSSAGMTAAMQISLIQEERIGETVIGSRTVASRVDFQPIEDDVTMLRPVLPLPPNWTYGFSTVLVVDEDDELVRVSSTFHIRIDVLFLPTPSNITSWTEIERDAPLPPRTLTIPIVIGSVAEPRGAMHTHRWSDLQLDDGGDRGRMVEGEAISCEDGWILPPPSYARAIEDAPYVYN